MPNNVTSNVDSTEAKNRIATGPLPGWVSECAYDREFKTDHHSHITYLLFDRQVHAERREWFEHTAIRLETLEAVQHQSQWRWQFEPQTQLATLHFLKVHRNGVEINHLNFAKGHLLQREEGLDRLIIQGWYTFLLVLEDVRVGDILEWAVTMETSQKVLPQNHGSFFTLPEWVSVGRYHYTARFDPARKMQWKASAPDLKPAEKQEGGLTVWTWTADKYAGLESEPNTPSWYVSAPWIQISDCADWRTIAAAIAEVWAKQEDAATLEEMVQEIEKCGPDRPARIAKAIEMIQDEYRYLSVNLEFGGQIPSPPQIVAQRRYGDCKDLSFLLVSLLKRLGVQARPVLVHANLRKSVGNVLPTSGIFNHVIVEFEIEGNRRWVDATMKRQGGGALNRVVDEFGLGLPVDPAATGLVESPTIPEQSNLYELHETVLLDTTGAPSLVAMVVRAEGSQAELLRQQYETTGLEEMAKQELQNCANRFFRATRVGKLQYRDDRATNRFFLAQVFEINGFLMANPNEGQCQFNIPSHWITNALLKPEKKERRTPFALPHKLQITHIIDIESPALNPGMHQISGPKSSLQNEYVKFHRTKKLGYGYWMTSLSIQVDGDSVPADQLEKYREFVGQVWSESLWSLNLPLGYSRPKKSRGFGDLPMAAAKLTPKTSVEPKTPVHSREVAASRVIATEARAAVRATQKAKPTSSKPRHSHEAKSKNGQRFPLWLLILAALLGMFLVVVVFTLLGR